MINLLQVRENIEKAGGPSSSPVLLVAVSKKQPIEAIREAYALGQRDFGENYVSNYLKDLGFKVIGRNYHTKHGEIDIIATKDGKIHFVEVKTRKSLLFGTPEEAYSLKKQERIIKAALGYLKDNNINKSFQIDLVALILNDKNEVLSITMYDNAINY